MPIGAGTLAAGAAIVAAFAWLFTSSDGNGGTTPGGGGGTTPGGGGGTTPGGGGGGGGGGGTTPSKPPAGARINPSTVEGGNAWWGDPSKIPADFDWNGAGIFVSTDCGTIAIGAEFAPPFFKMIGAGTRQTITTLDSAAVLSKGCVPTPQGDACGGTLWNFWLHLLLDQAFPPQPEDMAARVLADAAPLCADISDDLWPAGLSSFYDALVKDAVDFHEEWSE